MNKIVNILLLVTLLFCGCSGADLDMLEKQLTDIVKFLTTKHDPKLMSSKDVAESLDENPEFYTTYGDRAYRYIADYYNTDRLTRKEVKNGDTLYLTFWCYDFSRYSTPDEKTLYYTNDPAYRDAFIEAGLNIEYWSFEPQKIVLGKGDILNAIEKSLVGCKEGDSVEIYLTYNLAYGSNWIGITNLDSPMAFFCTINSVEN